MPSLANHDDKYHDSAVPAEGEPVFDDQVTSGHQKSKKKSAAQQLVELALERYDLGVDSDGKPYGVPKGGHVVRSLRGDNSLRKELGGMYRRDRGRPPSQNALSEAMSALEYEAEDSGEQVTLHLRAARPSDDEIFIDLGDKTERVIRVTADGWDVLDAQADVPVLFRRTVLTAPLPTPAPGGDFEQLWQFVNLQSEQDRQVLRGWLVAAMVLVGLPCPILALLGEQGTAKTSAVRSVFSLFDPTKAPVRRPSNDADSFLHAVHNSRATAFDNLSSIPRWMSDAMCRVVTGESDVNRLLYTNDESSVIKVQGVLGFTGIDVGALAGDLAERCVWGNLQVIPAASRRSERELNAAWSESYSSMVGGLLDLVVMTLQKLPEVSLAEKPRMADFAEVLAALDLATGAHGLAEYTCSQGSVAEEIVETDPFLMAVTSAITDRWEGTGQELYNLLPRPADDKYWPTPRGMAGKLRRVAPDLRKAGWRIEEVKPAPGSKRAKTWIIEPPGTVVSPADIASVELLRDLQKLDLEQWAQRLAADGVSPECIENHLEITREGFGTQCSSPTCTGLERRPEYESWVARSRELDLKYNGALRQLGLTHSELGDLIARRASAQERADTEDAA